MSGGSGIPGATVSILGDNMIAFAAAKQALINGANVNLIGEDYDKVLSFEPNKSGDNLQIFEYDRGLLNTIFLETDVLIAAGREIDMPSNIQVKLKDLKLLQQGSVIIDLTIDRHDLIEPARETKPTEPIYISDGLVFFAVNNLTAMLPMTASEVISQTTLPYIRQLTQIGIQEMIATNPEFRNSLVIYKGKIVHPVLTSDIQKEKSYDILELLELNI